MEFTQNSVEFWENNPKFLILAHLTRGQREISINLYIRLPELIPFRPSLSCSRALLWNGFKMRPHLSPVIFNIVQKFIIFGDILSSIPDQFPDHSSFRLQNCYAFFLRTFLLKELGTSVHNQCYHRMKYPRMLCRVLH